MNVIFFQEIIIYDIDFNIFMYLCSKYAYYAGIMLDAPTIVLCSKLCRHNVSEPTAEKQSKQLF